MVSVGTNVCVLCGILLCVERSIKLWKVYAKELRSFTEYNLLNSQGDRPTHTPIVATSRIRFPKICGTECVVSSSLRRSYGHNHAYHINSLSASCDQETFLSADDLRINIWHLDNPTENFNVVDMKPEGDLVVEVITRAIFDPKHANKFVYATSDGNVILSDTRASALLDRPRVVFRKGRTGVGAARHDPMAQISDVRFSRCSQYVMARDLMSLLIFDIRMNRMLRAIDVHEHLRPQILQLLDQDYMKFECHWSEDSQTVMTGSYSNSFNVYDVATGGLVSAHEAVKSTQGAKKKKPLSFRRRRENEMERDRIRFDEKIEFSSWHPTEKTLAVAAANTLYIYHAPKAVPASGVRVTQP